MIVQVLDHETYKQPNGKIMTTTSRPTVEPPNNDWKNFAWHDVMCKWVPVEKINEPCVFEMPDSQA